MMKQDAHDHSNEIFEEDFDYDEFKIATLLEFLDLVYKYHYTYQSRKSDLWEFVQEKMLMLHKMNPSIFSTQMDIYKEFNHLSRIPLPLLTKFGGKQTRPIHWALYFGDYEVVEFIANVENACEVLNGIPREEEPLTYLHIALRNGHGWKLIKFLQEKFLTSITELDEHIKISTSVALYDLLEKYSDKKKEFDQDREMRTLEDIDQSIQEHEMDLWRTTKENILILKKLNPSLFSTEMNIHEACNDINRDRDAFHPSRLVTCQSFFESNESVAVHWAVFFGNLEVVQLIGEADPEQIKVRMKSGFPCDTDLPLHVAIKRGHDLGLIQYLYEKYPESISMRNNTSDIFKGKNPFHLAILSEQSLDTIKFLLDMHPENPARIIFHNNTPLHYFLTFGSFDLLTAERLQLIIESYPEALSIRDGAYHNTPLGILLRRAQFDEDYYPIIKQIYEYSLHYDSFGPDCAGGLFERVYYTYDVAVDDSDDESSVWTSQTIGETAFEVFLNPTRLDPEPDDDLLQIERWDDALEVFGAAKGTIIVHPAIGKISDSDIIFPTLIEKFEVDLTRKDSRGMTALIITIFDRVFRVLGYKSTDNNNNESVDYHDFLYLDKRKDIQYYFGEIALMLGKGSPIANDEDIIYPAMIEDDNGRLPLHIAAEIGLKWSCGTEEIVNANMVALTKQCPVTGLYPFMLASCGYESADLTSIYMLLLSMPDNIKRCGL